MAARERWKLRDAQDWILGSDVVDLGHPTRANSESDQPPVTPASGGSTIALRGKACDRPISPLRGSAPKPLHRLPDVSGVVQGPDRWRVEANLTACPGHAGPSEISSTPGRAVFGPPSKFKPSTTPPPASAKAPTHTRSARPLDETVLFSRSGRSGSPDFPDAGHGPVSLSRAEVTRACVAGLDDLVDAVFTRPSRSLDDRPRDPLRGKPQRRRCGDVCHLSDPAYLA